MKLASLFPKFSHTPPERSIYALIVAKARQPWLYRSAGVPDTVTGRFDMITLHSFLLLEHLRNNGDDATEFSQNLFDEIFLDMDHSLREMGVGDLSVGKKVRKMSEVFYGACSGYRKALDFEGQEANQQLQNALKRNILGADASDEHCVRLVSYAMKVKCQIDEIPVKDIVSGKIDWPDIAMEG